MDVSFTFCSNRCVANRAERIADDTFPSILPVLSVFRICDKICLNWRLVFTLLRVVFVKKPRKRMGKIVDIAHSQKNYNEFYWGLVFDLKKEKKLFANISIKSI